MLLDSAIRQRYQVSPTTLTIHFQLSNGNVILGSATLCDKEPSSSLEIKCYFDAVRKLAAQLLSVDVDCRDI